MDASTAYKMNPLAALSIDQTALAENLHHHGGTFYHGIHPLSGEKAQTPCTSHPPGYDLLYKSDVNLLDSQKPPGGFVGLYKNSSPGLQKPLVVPVTGGNNYLMDQPIPRGDKQLKRGLNIAGSFPRLPWISQYADSAMYPFLDMAYNASFFTQPSAFLQQQLAYQTLCPSGPGGNTPREDIMFYLPYYPVPHISSLLGPPIRISTATEAPVVLSPLPHNQSDILGGVGTHVQQEPSAFSTSLKIHQESQSLFKEQQHGNSSQNQPSSFKSSTGSSRCTSVPVNCSTATSSTESSSVSHPPGSPALSINNPTNNLHTSVYRNQSLSVFQPSYMTSEDLTCSTKTKDPDSDLCSSEKQTLQHRVTLHKQNKTHEEKPVDLSSKELERRSSDSSSKMKALTKMDYLPTSQYEPLVSQDLRLQKGLSPHENAPLRSQNCFETISPLPSSWVVPSPSSKVSLGNSNKLQENKNKGVDHVSHQTPKSTVQINHLSPTSGRRPSAMLPSTKSKAECSLVHHTDLDEGPVNSKKHPSTSGKHFAKLEMSENQTHLQQQLSQLENHSRQVFCDSYPPTTLSCVPYSVAENKSLQGMSSPSKGPVYLHQAFLGGSHFYPPHVSPDHGFKHAIAPCPKSQELNSNPTSIYPDLNTKDRNQEKLEDEVGSRKESLKTSRKCVSGPRDETVCTDMVGDETEELFLDKTGEILPNPPKIPPPSQSEQKQGSGLLTSQVKSPYHNSALYSPFTDKIPEKIEGEETPLSSALDIPEEQNTGCARTCLQQFARKRKAESCIESVVFEGLETHSKSSIFGEKRVNNASQSKGLVIKSDDNKESPATNGQLLLPVNTETFSGLNNVVESMSTVTRYKSPPCATTVGSDDPVYTSMDMTSRTLRPQVPSSDGSKPMASFMRAPLCVGILKTSVCDTRQENCQHFLNRNFVEPFSQSQSVRSPSCESKILSDPTNVAQNNPRLTNCENQNEKTSPGVPVCDLSDSVCATMDGETHSTKNNQISVKDNPSVTMCKNNFPQSPNCQHLAPSGPGQEGFNGKPTNLKVELSITTKDNTSNKSDHLVPTSSNSGHAKEDISCCMDEAEELGNNRALQSGLNKHVVTDSGDTADKLKSVSSELEEDSNQLIGERKALPVRPFESLINDL